MIPYEYHLGRCTFPSHRRRLLVRRRLAENSPDIQLSRLAQGVDKAASVIRPQKLDYDVLALAAYPCSRVPVFPRSRVPVFPCPLTRMRLR